MPVVLSGQHPNGQKQKNLQGYCTLRKGKLQMSKTFKQAVNHIKQAERDVDIILDAARLVRNPINSKERLSMILETVTTITVVVIGAVTTIAIFWLMTR